MFFEIEIYSPRLRDHCAKSVTDISIIPVPVLLQEICRHMELLTRWQSVRPSDRKVLRSNSSGNTRNSFYSSMQVSFAD